MKRLVIKSLIPKTEIVHYAGPDRVIRSFFNETVVEKAGVAQTIKIPRRWWEALPGNLRLARRALRLDKCNVFPRGEELIIIRGGMVFHWEDGTGGLQPVLRLRNCRNVLHQSISITPDQKIYFGEYGANPERRPVPIYRSDDGGKSWTMVFEFPAGSIKHVHGCYYDRYEDSIWVCTGDFVGENRIVRADRDFKNLEWIGDGSQKFRTCNFFFTPDSVHWLMDSQLEQSFHVRFDRRPRNIHVGQPLPGPVWYSKQLTDGYYLAGTAQEVGPGVKDDHAHLLVSCDLESWEDLHSFSHDGWPKRYFKNGVIGFADGEQSSRDFWLFFEALSGFDGRAARCEIMDRDD